MQVQTVRGRIAAAEMGFTLPHEHVLCDFIGAEKTGPHRWKADEVCGAIQPLLQAVKERGVRTFVDCTPAYIGRDVRILERLSKETGLHILTNTGYYGAASDTFVPRHAFTETAEQLAERWVQEFEKGIEGTGIKPGFIKVGVDPASGSPAKLSEVDAKIVRAAALASRRTGLTIASHTVQGAAALAELAILEAERVPLSRFIYVHADGEPNLGFHRKVAAKGAWVEFDAIGWKPTEEHAKQVLPIIEEFPNRVLLAMDHGWYNAGEANGGTIRDYTSLTDVFLPALRKAGVSDATIRRLTVENPAQAFAIADVK